MQTVKMALVGAGTWGANHARIYKAHPFADVVAICDMDRGKAEKVAQEEGIQNVYDDYNKMIAECGCDAVAIVTPDFAHADIAVAAANAGKHILIEKPLATTREDVFRILESGTQTGTKLNIYLVTSRNIASHVVGRQTDAKFVVLDFLYATNLHELFLSSRRSFNIRRNAHSRVAPI